MTTPGDARRSGASRSRPPVAGDRRAATRRSWPTPRQALDDLLAAEPELDREQQQAQLEAVLPAFGADRSLDRETIGRWSTWDARHGIVEEAPDPDETFDFEVAEPAG